MQKKFQKKIFLKIPQKKKFTSQKSFKKSFQKKLTYLWQRQKACLRERLEY